jgi:hypothetical protein
MADLAGTKPMLAALRGDVLGTVLADGTWLECEFIGKPYGTAMALTAMRFTR